MFIFFSAKVLNIVAATPACDFIPTPTKETLLMSSFNSISPPPNSLDKLEALLSTRLPALGDKSKEALSNFFKIDQSAEVSSLQALLTSDIPAYSEAARKSLDPFIKKLTEGDVEGAIKVAGSIVGQLTKQFPRGLGMFGACMQGGGRFFNRF